MYDKRHKPSVPAWLRYIIHERGKDDKNVEFLNLNFGHLHLVL